MVPTPTTYSPSPLTDPAAALPPASTLAAQVRQTVVLAGPEALPLREAIENQLMADPEATPIDFVFADSILEAVFLAAEPVADANVPKTLLFAGISREADQLESATRSLRQVYPQARIYFLCDAGDEVPCRKAKAWGATDYLLLPVDIRSLERVLRATPPAPAELPRGSLAEVKSLPLSLDSGGAASLPLHVQTTLLHDLMTGRANFLDRALATLQDQMQWEGILSLEPAADTQAEIFEEGHAQGVVARAPILLPGLPSLGTLVLTRPNGGSPFAAVPESLFHAAHWLGALLAASQRYDQLRTMAITDELSGAYNRRYFNKFMLGLLDRARLNRFRVTLLLFDIDDFKKYNDSFGHASGDAIIRELIQLLRACTRPHDIVARLGGDEFAVVYWDNEAPRQPNSQHPKDVLAATERFRNAIKSHEWPGTCNIQGQISISGGLATFPWDADSLEQLTAKADEALLRAKAAGKNVILLHGCEASEPADGGLPSRNMTLPQN